MIGENRIKPQTPLCPPRNPHVVKRTRDPMVGDERLTACATRAPIKSNNIPLREEGVGLNTSAAKQMNISILLRVEGVFTSAAKLKGRSRATLFLKVKIKGSQPVYVL